MKIWISRGGDEVFGPYALPQVQDMVTRGQLAPATDWAQLEGGGEWIPLGNVPGLSLEPEVITPAEPRSTPAEPRSTPAKGNAWSTSRTLLAGAAVGVGLVAVAGTAALVWLMVRNRAWQRLVLDSETDRASGFDTAPAGLAGLVSESGVAQTPLRPSGRAQFGEQFVDVVTEGDFIDSGTRIEVLSVNGNRVVVQEQAAPAGVDAGAE